MSEQKRNELGVFFHMMYELNKGLRSLALLTTTTENFEIIKERLDRCSYEYILENLKSGYVNIFFGTKECIEVLKKFKKNSLKIFHQKRILFWEYYLGIMYNNNVKDI